MGTVWLAEHTMLERRAAIKLLRPMFVAQPVIVKRFFNEARAAAKIADPGIVQIFDLGYHSDGSAYIAMEMLDGETLERRLKRLGKLTLNQALRIVRQVASTLGVTHAHGIVHRDLKPENIFLVPDPEVPGGERSKVLDFGIAKLTGEATLKTDTAAVMGTPAYMAPEQCRGAGFVDQRADVYSMGCILFALLCGHTPFQAKGAGELIAMHLREAPPAPSSHVPGLPPEIDALVLRCLAKDPEQRFASGTELAAALARLLGTSTAFAAAIPEPTSPDDLRTNPDGTTTLSLGPVLKAALAPARRAWIAGAATLIGGLIIVAVMTGRAEPTSSQSAERIQPPTPPPTAPARPAVASPVVASPAVAASEAAIKPPSDDGALDEQMKTVLAQFMAWSREHSGKPCPQLSELGEVPNDPWGTAFTLTCSRQPEQQIAGVISAGPDGKLDTPDDLFSWQRSQDVTAQVKGPRWGAQRPKKKRGRPSSNSDGIPTKR